MFLFISRLDIPTCLRRILLYFYITKHASPKSVFFFPLSPISIEFKYIICNWILLNPPDLDLLQLLPGFRFRLLFTRCHYIPYAVFDSSFGPPFTILSTLLGHMNFTAVSSGMLLLLFGLEGKRKCDLLLHLLV